MEKLRQQEKNKTQNVPFAMMATARIRMQLCSATDATWLFIKSAMGCLSSRRVNGFVGSAN
jgi:hypothetical protein